MYLPVQPSESDSSPDLQSARAPWRISSVYDLKQHTTTVIHFLLRSRNFVVVVVDIPTLTVELIDGYWTKYTSKIRRNNLDRAVTQLMCNACIWPRDVDIKWELHPTEPFYTVMVKFSTWKLKYKPVPSQQDSYSCGPRACSAAATIFYPDNRRSTNEFT